MYKHIDLTTPSSETTVRQVEHFVAVADQVPAGSPINVAFVEDLPVAERLAAYRTLAAAGLRVRPILSTRRIASEAELTELLSGITGDLEIRELLIVGGDPTEPAGPYATALELIRSAPIAESDVQRIGLPGFPKDHPTTLPEVLLEHLVEKVEAIQAADRDVEITTQLCLDPNAVSEWIAQVRAHGITAPIRIGVPAPSSPARLLRFCELCRVEATLEELQRFGWLPEPCATRTDPTAFLHTLSKLLTPGLGPITTHMYPMGELRATLGWWSSLR